MRYAGIFQRYPIEFAERLKSKRFKKIKNIYK